MKKNNKGFTLAELLIVVAIIGVLVAVAIPTFTGQLNKAKYATDEANARSIYAELSADYLGNGGKQSSAFSADTVNGWKVEAGTAKTVVVTGPDGTVTNYSFNGICDITFEAGDSEHGPKVTIGKCAYNGNTADIVFGGSAIGTAEGADD